MLRLEKDEEFRVKGIEFQIFIELVSLGEYFS